MASLRSDQLAGNLERGLNALYIVHGDKPLLAMEAVDAIRAKAREKGFTERDVLVRVVAAGLDPQGTPVGEVMTRSPVAVRSGQTVGDAMRIITERRCRHLPVIDDNRLHGLISIGDLTSWLVRDQERTIADLHDYMNRA